MPGYLRYPHVHGDLITFAAEDDIWLAPAAGGRAWKLTTDGAAVVYPRFSPDGSKVAWTSWRDHAPEVYTLDTDGSAPARLTYWGNHQTRTCGWVTDNEVLATSAVGQPAGQYSWAYAVPLDGPPRRLPYGPVADLALAARDPAEAASQTGHERAALLTGRMDREPAFWKRYRGGSTGRLWTATAEDPLFARVLADLDGQFSSPMLTGGRLAFLADHEGTGNVYSCALDGSDLRRHTSHDGFYARNPATDGQRIVYHVAGDIWLLDNLADDAEPRKVDIILGSPSAARAPRLITAADHCGELMPDETGQASVVEVLGTVHWLAHADGPARALSVDPKARARDPRILGTEGMVIWVTDADGPDALEIAGTSGEPAGTRRIAAGELGYVTSLAPSPDGTHVAVAAHDGRLLLVTVEPAQVIELAAPDNGPISGLAWSPDSAWLAWSQPGPGRLARIRMARITPGGDNIPTAPSDPRSAIIDVTDGRFADTEPAFTTDGLYLAFLSRRTFDPIYDAHSLDLSFPFGSRPYLVPLAAETMSPFGPWPGGRPVTHSESMKDDSERPGVTLDTEGIQSRVVAVPVDEGRYAGLAAVRGGLAWMRGTVSGVLAEGAQDRPRPALERFDLRKSESALLASEVDWYTVSGDGARLVIGDGSDVRVQPADRKADDDSSDDVIPVDLTRARYLADPAALWAHAFDEAGRIIRRDFWTPDMSGVDWDGVLDAYRPLLAAVRTSAEFADLLWEVFAELGTSHAYVHASWEFGVPESRGTAVGVLGADVVRSGDGHWLVERVLPGESSDPLARSPLAAPGVAVRAGEEIAEVDGRPVDPARGPWPLLVATAGKPVELALRQPETPQTRRVVIVPLHDDGRLRYQDWVAGRRRFVRQRSEGKAGYLHIPDMNAEGWAHLHRDLKIEMGREALIVDVRGNLGGNTSELIIEKLARRIIGWSHPRGLRAVSYPRDAPRGPVVALADEFAASDGDMVTAAIRIMRLGPVVGTRTWGGVIGFDGWESLADGTCITVPGYAHWFGEYGWGVENHGVDPDVEVLITPDDWAVGRDTQLEAAVDMALAALASRPAPAMPDPATGPSKRRPLLPPRQR